jgi:hypothetical protein
MRTAGPAEIKLPAVPSVWAGLPGQQVIEVNIRASLIFMISRAMTAESAGVYGKPGQSMPVTAYSVIGS